MVGLGRAGDDAHASSRNERLSDTDILIEDVFGYPAPGSLHPIDFQWSPDGALLGNLFSPNGTIVRNLYAYDVRAGAQRLLATPAREAYADEARLPDEEKLRRERTRELGLGVTRFEWASRRAKGEARRLLVPQSDGAYILDVVDDDAPRGRRHSCFRRRHGHSWRRQKHSWRGQISGERTEAGGGLRG